MAALKANAAGIIDAEVGGVVGDIIGTETDTALRLIEGRGTPDADWQHWLALQQVQHISVTDLVPFGARALIIAPHPDDEVLGCGGLLQMLASHHREITLIAVTDGSASHPGSPIWPAERLARVRREETTEALARLMLFNINVVRADVPDGHVCKHTKPLAALIVRLAQPGDVIFCTWRHDGHPDHEASYAAAAAAAFHSHARLIELPIWMWHWARPGNPSIPWHRMRRLALDDKVIECKRAAIRCYRSQLECDVSTGSTPILPPHVLERLLHPEEYYFV